MSAAGTSVPASGVGVQLCPSVRVQEQVLLVLRRRILLWRLDLLPCPLLCLVRPADSSVRKSSPARADIAIVRPAVGLAERVIDDLGNAPPSPVHSSRRREASYRSSSGASEEDRAELPPPSSGRVPGGTPDDSRPAPAGDRSPLHGPSFWRPRSSAAANQYRSGFGGHLSPLLRVRWTLTLLMPPIPWTLTGMTLSGLSWPSSGTSMAWKSRQVYHQLDARLLLHQSMG